MGTKTANRVISRHTFTDACNFSHECRTDPYKTEATISPNKPISPCLKGACKQSRGFSVHCR